MKNQITKSYFLLSLTLLIFIFTCRTEDDLSIDPPLGEVLETGSKIAELLAKVTLKDGSIDNAIDNSSSLTVQLPVTVIVNGTTIVIKTLDDLEKIQEIYDQSNDDEDQLVIIYPITVITPYHSKIVVNSKAELIALSPPKNANEEDDDIECIDLIYPVIAQVFNANTEIAETITITNDEKMYNFIQNLDELAAIRVRFPLKIKTFDGETASIEHIEALEAAIEAAEGTCDENDEIIIEVLDDDGDGVNNDTDTNPTDPSICADTDEDGCDDCSQTGADGSGGDPANDGTDTDGDGICDTSDPDIDGDGVENATDSDPTDPNICTDTDDDGCDDCSQTRDDGSGGDPANDGPDADGDGICDSSDPDIDNDGVDNASDNNPTDPNICRDTDRDGCDDCSQTRDDGSGGDPDNDGLDTDGDGICDSSDPDIDNDGVDNASDNNPTDPNMCKDDDDDGCDDCSQTGANGSGGDTANDGTDTDNDGICDSSDPDIDNDGVGNASDNNPTDPNMCKDDDDDGCDDCSQTGANESGGDIFNDGPDADGDGICDFTDTEDDDCNECTQDDLIEIFNQCSNWTADQFRRDGDVLKNDYKDYFFTFNNDNTISVISPDGTFEGSWGVTGSGTALNLQIEFTGVPNLEIFNATWNVKKINPIPTKKQVDLNFAENDRLFLRSNDCS